MKRLTPALLTMVMFGVVGLLVAAYVAKSLLAVESGPTGPRTRNVPMAIVDIPAGVEVSEQHVGQGPLAIDELSTMPDVLLVNRVIVGRVAREAIKAATPFRANQLYQPGEQPPLQVEEGYRAVSVSVGDSVSMVDGMIAPKNFVDVLFTVTSGDDDRTQGGVTLRLFEGVKVLAVNRNHTTGRVVRTDNKVTLELTAPQVVMLELAQKKGDISLAYNPQGRGNGGIALNNAERVTLYELLGLKEAAPEAEPFLTEIFRGKDRSPNRFNDKGRLVENFDANRTLDRNGRLTLPPAAAGAGTATTPGAPLPAEPSTGVAPTAQRLRSITR